MTGVSFVVPVRNGVDSVREMLESLFAQADGRPMEIIVIDDGSTDGSTDLICQTAAGRPLVLLTGPNRGAAAAINVGIRAATFPIVCQVDQDVVLRAHWMSRLVAELDDPHVAAVQGRYVAEADATLFVRVMGWDLEQRYAAIDRRTDHVCTGNCAYRADAIQQVGFFDESLGYGYDNDMSYRLLAAGYRLTFCRGAESVHRWREGLTGYIMQQYGFGYGRLDLVAKHPGRVAGDTVSPFLMMSHPLLMFFAVLLAATGLLLTIGGLGMPQAYAAGAILVMVLAGERLVSGIVAARRFRKLVPLLFPLIHLVRDLAWTAAIVVWLIRRLFQARSIPSHSMRVRDARSTPVITGGRWSVVGGATNDRAERPRALVLIPAHNEAASLPAVIAELKGRRPDLAILVIDDGSTDETPAVIEGLDVLWLRFPERMGVGAAVRAGLRYAVRLDYGVAVRLDGDGQHRPEDIDRLLAPLACGENDVVLGTRYLDRRVVQTGAFRWLRRPLAACLTTIIGRPVTDPTSGCYALGPQAVRLLSEHHPTGYPEPELQLFLSRNGLRVVEVPVAMRARANGRTSLTPSRLVLACARVLLAMVIVPLRCAVREIP